jgi:hypothetical protein
VLSLLLDFVDFKIAIIFCFLSSQGCPFPSAFKVCVFQGPDIRAKLGQDLRLAFYLIAFGNKPEINS